MCSLGKAVCPLPSRDVNFSPIAPAMKGFDCNREGHACRVRFCRSRQARPSQRINPICRRFYKRCALLKQEVCTSFLRACNPPANRLAQPPTPLLRNAASFVAQGSIFCCATKSTPLQNSEPPNLQVTKVRKLCGLKRTKA